MEIRDCEAPLWGWGLEIGNCGFGRFTGLITKPLSFVRKGAEATRDRAKNSTTILKRKPHTGTASLCAGRISTTNF
jgi:hypothetical protein